jgi:hypothetical protein
LDLTASGGALVYSVTAPLDKAVTFGANGKGLSSGLGSLPTGANPRTIITIFKSDGTTNKQLLWSYGGFSTRNWFALLVNDGGNPFINLGTFADDLSATAVGTIDASHWLFVAAVYDGSTTLKVYINSGNNNGTNASFLSLFPHTLSGALNTSASGNFTVGIDTVNTQPQFSGQIDEITVFNRALNDVEIMALYVEACQQTPLA